MKPFRILGIAFVALLALSAFAVSSASAAVTFLLAEWLLNALAITTPDLVESTGELNLINLNGGGFGIVTELLCSGVFVGTVGPNSAGETTEVLNLALELISSTVLVGLSIDCANTKNCEGALVWPENLPWKSELELMENDGGTFFVNLLLNAAYYGVCTILGIKVEELCEAPEVAIESVNEAAGVDQAFSEAFQTLAELKLGTCGGRAETAETEGLGTIVPVGGGTLTVSE